MNHNTKSLCFALLSKHRRDTDPISSLVSRANEIANWCGEDPLKILAVELISGLKFHASTGGFYLQQCCDEVYVFLKGPELESETPTQDNGQAREVPFSAEPSEPSGDVPVEDEVTSGAPETAYGKMPEHRTPRHAGKRTAG